VGLIGGSIALRARTLGWKTIGWDRDAAVASAACASGALSSRASSLVALAARAEVLVLAGPVDATIAQLAELAEIPGGALAALVLDVGSVKAPIARAGRKLPAFVPTHPIAGSEKRGPESARADLFVDRTWAYDPELHPEAGRRAPDFIAAMGARAYAIGSEEHDRLVALTSHLPQILSVALGARLRAALDEPATTALCGPGMRSMLRLAQSSFSMWGPVLAANAQPVAQEVRALAAILSMAASALESGATGDLGGLFDRAAASAAALAANDAGPSVVTRAKDVTDER